MLLTPTYYVFDMYKVFQGATYLPLDIQAPSYVYGGLTVPSLHGTAARGADGLIHLGLVNLDPHRAALAAVSLVGVQAHSVSGQIMTADQMDAHNTFDAPNTLKPAPFHGARLNGQDLEVSLPAKSVVVLELR
jgi:alpha-N-arabinofuranosidase